MVKSSCPKLEKIYTYLASIFVESDERDELMRFLDERGVGTIIHYPIPPHLLEAYQYLGIKEWALPITEKYAKSVFSIPLYNGMTREEQDYVIKCINEFGY